MSKPRIMIAEARFYPDLADELARGATVVLDRAGARYERIFVPGALEIPVAIAMAERRGDFDAYIALGCVIRGQTSHYDIVAGQSARAIMDLAIRRGLAFGNAILTVENKEQARMRADTQGCDKGGMAARAALTMIDVKTQLERP